MRCITCPKDAIIYQPYSGKYLCPRHLRQDIEAKAKRTIRIHSWLVPRDHIGVALTGDTRSSALLVFLCSLLSLRRDICLTAIIIGDKGEDMPDERIALAQELGVPIVRIAQFDRTDMIMGRLDNGTLVAGRDQVREVLSQVQLGRFGKANGMTKIATSRSLDDEANGVLISLITGNAGELFTAAHETSTGIPFIHPFITIPDNEIQCYAGVAGLRDDNAASTVDGNGLAADAKSMVDTYAARHPSAKYSLMHLGDEIRSAGTDPASLFPGCPMCGRPGSGTCLRCRIHEEVNSCGA